MRFFTAFPPPHPTHIFPRHPPFPYRQYEGDKGRQGEESLHPRRATTGAALGSAGEEQAKITLGWEGGVELPFLFGWTHSGFRFLPVYWDNFWPLVHMALEVANPKWDGSRICFPTHLLLKSLGSHF